MAFGQDATITLNIVAKDLASGNINKVRSSIQTLGSKTGGPLGGMISGFAGISGPAMAAGLALGLVGKAVSQASEFLAVGVRSAVEEEKSLARLDAALKANVENWDGNRDAIDAAVQARMRLGFQDDELRASLAKLVAANGDVNQSLQLQSIAMDMSRAGYGTLEEASQKLIRAGAGNTRVLKELGIEIRAGASDLEIYAAIQERVAGQASAWAQTTEGKVARANIQVEELAENLGGVMLPILGDVAEGWNNIADQMNGVSMIKFQMPRDAVTFGAEARQGMTDSYRHALQVMWHHNREYASEIAIQTGDLIAKDLAGAVRGSDDVVAQAMEDLLFAMNNPMEAAKKLARIEGAIMSAQLAAGLASQNPYVRGVAQQQLNILTGQWESITGVAYRQGVSAANNYERGLSTFNPPNLNPFRNHSPGRPGGGRQHGGSVMAGEGYIVGERRPELFVPDVPGHVYPSVGNRGSGANVFVTFQSLVLPSPTEAQRAAQAFVPELTREMRRQRIIN